jgi:hypothetical protein
VSYDASSLPAITKQNQKKEKRNRLTHRKHSGSITAGGIAVVKKKAYMREDAQPNKNVQFLLSCASYGLLPWLIKVSSMLQDSTLTKLNLFLQHLGVG